MALNTTNDEKYNLKSAALDYAKKAGSIVKDKWNESSTTTKAAIVGTGAALTAPLIIIPILDVVGFTSAGIAAGSIAASMQTSTTAAGSLFALAQSAGATSTVALSTPISVGLGAAGVTFARNQNNSNERINDGDQKIEDRNKNVYIRFDNMASNSTDGSNTKSFFERACDVNSSFMNYATQAGSAMKTTGNAAKDTWQESSTLTKAITAGFGAALTVPFTVIPVLGAIGFKVAGVAAGSIAASMQTASTAAGSLFALAQSAGATGAVAASTSVGIGVGSGITAGGITAAMYRTKSGESNETMNK